MRPTIDGLPRTHYATFLRQLPLFAGLPESTVATLVPHLQPHCYPRQAIIVHAHDPGYALFLLTTGMVKLILEAADGRALRLATLHPPAYFGEMALLDGDAQGIQAIALTPCEVLLLPRPPVLALLDHVPGVVQALATRLSQHLRAAAALSARLAWCHAHAQVAQAVLSAVHADGGAPTPGAARVLPLACRDLLELTGLARGTIHRVLRDFQQAGALAVVGRQLHVLDTGYLAQVQARLSGQNGM